MKRARWWIALLLLPAAVGCGGDDNPPPASSDAGDVGVDIATDPDTDSEIDEFVPVGLIINEVAAAETPDWFELYNGTPQTLDLTGWTFTDDSLNPQRAEFDGTTIRPGQYLVVRVSNDEVGFGLGGDEELLLYDPDLTLIDSVDWNEGDSPAGGSYGRIPDLTGGFVQLLTSTPGRANVDNPGGAVCGNDVQEEGEDCDDGNRTSGDGCSAFCTVEDLPECGNDEVEGDEECDGPDIPAPYTDCDDRCRVVPLPSDVRINEVVSQPAEGRDSFELTNNGTDPIDLTDWTFTDDDPVHVGVLSGMLLPGAYLVVTRDEDFDFGLGAADSVVLYDDGGFKRDTTSWLEDDAPAGSSWSRSPDGTGDFTTATPPTLGESND